MATAEVHHGQSSPPSTSLPATSAVSSSPLPVIDHTNHLVGLTRLLAAIALNLANCVAFMDFMSIAALLPTLGKFFGAEDTMEWAPTSTLIGATVGLCLLGYFSNFYGRKAPLLLALGLLVLGSIGCGLCHNSRSATMYYLCRAMTAVATGSISNLVNVAQNDFLPSDERPKWQGIQGISVGIGSGLGMYLGAVCAGVGWRIMYYTTGAAGLAAMLFVWLWVPSKVKNRPTWVQTKAIMSSVDWIGILTGTATIVPGLVLATQSRTLTWPGGASVSLPVVAGLSCVAFIMNGFKGPLCFGKGHSILLPLRLVKSDNVRPIIPFWLFRNRIICAIYVQYILLGYAYNTLIVYMPMFFIFVREYSLEKSAVLMLPYVVTHAVWSTLSALIVSKLEKKGYGSYIYMFLLGFSCWTTAIFVMGKAPHLTDVQICFLLVMIGIGTGGSFQNSVNAIRSQVSAADNAVATGTRNVLRNFGGSLGTASSSIILAMSLMNQLPDRLDHYAKNPFTRPDTSLLSKADVTLVNYAFRLAIQAVFTGSGIPMAICLGLCVFLIRPTKGIAAPAKRSEESSLVVVEMQECPPSDLESSESDLHLNERARVDSAVEADPAKEGDNALQASSSGPARLPSEAAGHIRR